MADQRSEPGGRMAVLALLVVGAAATLAYWVIWFGIDRRLLASATSESYFAFENAFPLADAWLATTLGLGALALWRRRASALLWLLLGGSAALYLAGMDILFDLENGIYGAPTGDVGNVVVEVLINLFCLIGGAVAVGYGWRHRRYFLGLER